MSDHWTDPRVELPDADIAVKVVARDLAPEPFPDDLNEFDARYLGDAEWRDGCDQSYITAEIVVWRHLTDQEANA